MATKREEQNEVTQRAGSNGSKAEEANGFSVIAAETELGRLATGAQRIRKAYEEAKGVSQKTLDFEVCL